MVSCARRCATAGWRCWQRLALQHRLTSPARAPLRMRWTTCATPSARTVRPPPAAPSCTSAFPIPALQESTYDECIHGRFDVLLRHVTEGYSMFLLPDPCDAIMMMAVASQFLPAEQSALDLSPAPFLSLNGILWPCSLHAGREGHHSGGHLPGLFSGASRGRIRATDRCLQELFQAGPRMI